MKKSITLLSLLGGLCLSSVAGAAEPVGFDGAWFSIRFMTKLPAKKSATDNNDGTYTLNTAAVTIDSGVPKWVKDAPETKATATNNGCFLYFKKDSPADPASRYTLYPFCYVQEHWEYTGNLQSIVNTKAVTPVLYPLNDGGLVNPLFCTALAVDGQSTWTAPAVHNGENFGFFTGTLLINPAKKLSKAGGVFVKEAPNFTDVAFTDSIKISNFILKDTSKTPVPASLQSCLAAVLDGLGGSQQDYCEQTP